MTIFWIFVFLIIANAINLTYRICQLVSVANKTREQDDEE